MVEDEHGALWLGSTSNGVLLYQSGRFRPLVSDFMESVRTILFDSFGNALIFWNQCGIYGNFFWQLQIAAKSVKPGCNKCTQSHKRIGGGIGSFIFKAVGPGSCFVFAHSHGRFTILVAPGSKCACPKIRSDAPVRCYAGNRQTRQGRQVIQNAADECSGLGTDAGVLSGIATDIFTFAPQAEIEVTSGTGFVFKDFRQK